MVRGQWAGVEAGDFVDFGAVWAVQASELAGQQVQAGVMERAFAIVDRRGLLRSSIGEGFCDRRSEPGEAGRGERGGGGRSSSGWGKAAAGVRQ